MQVICLYQEGIPTFAELLRMFMYFNVDHLCFLFISLIFIYLFFNLYGPVSEIKDYYYYCYIAFHVEPETDEMSFYRTDSS